MVAYSVWGVGYLKAFPGWTAKDTEWIYSFGTLGAFNMLLGGFLYDRVGPMWTYRLGLLLIYAGAGGTTLCVAGAARLGGLSPSVFAALYFVQETGMATLWTTVSVETVRHFPKYVPLTMGLIVACFDLSGVLWSTVFEHVKLDLVHSIWLIVGVVTVVTLPQFVLGPMGSGRRQEFPEVLWPAYAQAFGSPAFFVFVVIMFVMGPWEVVRGILMQLGTSAGITSKWFVPVILTCAAAGMVSFGVVYATNFQQWSSLTVLTVSTAVMLFGCTQLLAASHAGASASLTWIGAGVYYFGAGGLKTGSPLWSKERFAPEILGGVEAVRNLLIGVATVFATEAVGPVRTNEPRYFHTLMVTALATATAGVMSLGALGFVLRKNDKHERLPLLHKEDPDEWWNQRLPLPQEKEKDPDEWWN